MSDSYLLIENIGVAPIEGLTLFGASMTRAYGNDDTIGQFGSGSKHAISLLMRHDINPIIYCGNLRLEFYPKYQTVKDEKNELTVRRVCVRITGKDSEGKQNNREEELGWTLEHGVFDWNNVSMALREFVSNALDRSQRETGTFNDVRVEVVNEKPRAKTGWKHTRVYIPFTTAVATFHSQLGKRFLHFSEQYNLKARILPKANRDLNVNPGKPQGNIYKNGVFVRSIRQNTLFDYNFGKDFELDESRNSSESSINGHILKNLLFTDSAAIREKVITELLAGTAYHEFSNCYLTYDIREEFDENTENATKAKQNWQIAWNKIAGTNGIVTCGIEEINTAIRFKGWQPKPVLSDNWREILKKLGIKGEKDVLTQDEIEGKEILPPTDDVNKCFEKVWGLLESFGRLQQKPKPTLNVFKKVMDAGNVINGYAQGNGVYINDLIANGQSKKLFKVMLEEVVHYVTGARDFSRDIQDFLFTLVTDMSF